MDIRYPTAIRQQLTPDCNISENLARSLSMHHIIWRTTRKPCYRKDDRARAIYMDAL